MDYLMLKLLTNQLLTNIKKKVNTIMKNMKVVAKRAAPKAKFYRETLEDGRIVIRDASGKFASKASVKSAGSRIQTRS
jgi:hypothetical protein